MIDPSTSTNISTTRNGDKAPNWIKVKGIG